MKTVAIYERVSTIHQSEEGYSIGEQEERLQLFAKAHGWIVTGIYSDPGYSGGKLDRPAIQRLIKDARNHAFDAVIIYKLDRLSRSQKDTLYLIEDVFNPSGVGLISMQENFDTTTSFGKAMIGILSVFAQLERGQITERMTMGRIGRAKAGYFSGGSRPPIGYTYQKAENGEKNTLQIDEYEAMQVREIFRMFLEEDLSFKEISRRMHAKYTTRYGDWTNFSAIPDILRSRVYIGEVSFGGKWYPGIHKPIISRDTFLAAQKKLEKYSDSAAGRSSLNFRGAHLLTGLIRCGLCGSRYFVKSYRHTLKDSTVKWYRKYTCYAASGNNRNRTGQTHCDNVAVPLEELESFVIGQIRDLAINSGRVDAIASSQRREVHDDGVTQAMKAKLDDLNRQQEKLIDLYQVGAIDISAVRKRADTIKAERDKVTKTLAETEVKEKKANLTVAEAKRKLEGFEEVFQSGTLDDQRSFIRALIDEIVIFPGNGASNYRVEIHWAFVTD